MELEFGQICQWSCTDGLCNFVGMTGLAFIGETGRMTCSWHIHLVRMGSVNMIICKLRRSSTCSWNALPLSHTHDHDSRERLCA